MTIGIIPKMLKSGRDFVIQGVSFRIVFFETVAITKILDFLTTKYDFYMAKSWSFWNLFLLSQKRFQRGAQLCYENVAKYF